MRKYLIPIIALVMAISLSSFSKKSFIVYFVYNGTGSQNFMGSYEQTVFTQSWIPGTDVLAWFSIDDDDGSITTTEFNTAFETLDVYADSWNSLDDDLEVRTGQYQLEKKEL